MLSEELRNFVHTNFNFRSTLFWLHQNRQLKKFKALFDTIESNPLTELQRRAVILDERRNLVVAGAGSGKTSVIIAKAAYLIESGACEPEDILLLAFNADAAKELVERCKERIGVEVAASTFHALGNQILQAAETVAPTLSNLATDVGQLSHFLDQVIEEIASDKKAWRDVRGFVLGHLKPYRPESDFNSHEEYAAYTRAVELRALSGDLVKSFEELDIANFLFHNGVKFEYERRYPFEAKRYQPDFYLPDYDLWLEHFGVDKEGNTAPYIDKDAYTKEMEWKRVLHQAKGTTLLETYSWEKSEGILTQNLNELLKEHNVRYAPRSEEEIADALEDAGYISELSVLVRTFLSHFKSNRISLEQLQWLARRATNPKRAAAFIGLFKNFYHRYQLELDRQDPRQIDFSDMISSAADHVRAGRFEVPWRYIIVDEFQDISMGRYNLLDAMLRKRKDLKFFAVGDDWQAIYRFAGSDISIMRNFRKFFGRATVVKLDKTFRFNDKIADVSGRFVQENPDQIKKTLTTLTTRDTPAVILHWVEPGSFKPETTAKHIAGGEDVSNKSLLYLARYNHLLPDKDQHQAISEAWSGKVLPSLTIHRSKGLEADYVVLNGLTADRYGFPSEIPDDPLLNLVLAEPEAFRHAEERRLFYVALTRARHEVHLIVDRASPSPFVRELMLGDYEITHIGKRSKRSAVCPGCGTGRIIEKKGRFGGCTNFPSCKYTAPACCVCDSDYMLLDTSGDEPVYKCRSETCGAEIPVCPKCEIGGLVEKQGKHGPMVSCSAWPECDYVDKDATKAPQNPTMNR